MNWDIEVTDEFASWYDALDREETNAVKRAVDLLAAEGPGLGRPMVDTLRGSRYTNMKELRPRRGNLRVLFAFDPRRSAILLLGGDKTGQWNDWYRRMVPVAERLYEKYLEVLRKEGLIK